MRVRHQSGLESPQCALRPSSHGFGLPCRRADALRCGLGKTRAGRRIQGARRPEPRFEGATPLGTHHDSCVYRSLQSFGPWLEWVGGHVAWAHGSSTAVAPARSCEPGESHRPGGDFATQGEIPGHYRNACPSYPLGSKSFSLHRMQSTTTTSKPHHTLAIHARCDRSFDKRSPLDSKPACMEPRSSLTPVPVFQYPFPDL